MPSGKKSIWLEEFRAGQALESQFPYANGTPEAKARMEGWAQGLHLHCHRLSAPEDADFDDSELEDAGSE